MEEKKSIQCALTPGPPPSTGTYFAVIKCYVSDEPQMCVLHYQAHKNLYRAVGHAFNVEVKADDVVGYVGEIKVPGAVWVKASRYVCNDSGFHPARIETNIGAKYVYVTLFVSKGNGEAFISDGGNVVSQHNDRWDKYEILDESGTPATGREEDAVAIFEELWDEHAEYIDDNIDELVRWAGSTVVTREQFNKMMAKFKQQKEK